jgi:hypothetical protein
LFCSKQVLGRQVVDLVTMLLETTVATEAITIVIIITTTTMGA